MSGALGVGGERLRPHQAELQRYGSDQECPRPRADACAHETRLSTWIKDQNSLTLETFKDIKGADAFLALFRLDN
jgi:hypothetical protein